MHQKKKIKRGKKIEEKYIYCYIYGRDRPSPGMKSFTKRSFVEEKKAQFLVCHSH